ncbi:TPA: triose-phosphate isomerase [Streptococcus suis]
MRRPIVGMSMKLYRNKQQDEAIYSHLLVDLLGSEEEVELFYCPSLSVLHIAAPILEYSSIQLGAQNIASIANGALTGEYSIEGLIEQRGAYAEIGHAERRLQLNESDYLISKKVKLALEHGVTPLLCIGEQEKFAPDQRSQFLERQLLASLAGVDVNKLDQLVLAYEPVWAIGQADAADAQYVHESHQILRELLEKHFGEEVAQQIRILYGGSVSAENAAELVDSLDVDGLFVGRFGHIPQQLASIVSTVKTIKLER